MSEDQQALDDLRAALRKVVDPEAGVNIVDLGLVYGLRRSGAVIELDLTMTSAACPMADLVEDEARAALAAAVPGCEVRVRRVWDPPWTPEMMSDRARRTLGWD